MVYTMCSRSQPSVGSSLPVAAAVVPVTISLVVAGAPVELDTGRMRMNAPVPVTPLVLTYAESE